MKSTGVRRWGAASLAVMTWCGLGVDGRAAATAHAAAGAATMAGTQAAAAAQAQAPRAGAPAGDAPTTAELVKVWDAEHVSAPLPPLLTHREVVAHVTQIVKETPDLFAQEVIGQSVDGRSLHHVTFGKGPMHILLWSQMHGDEPTATAALFDLHAWIRAHRSSPVARRILERLTVHTVPMLNPDGAERAQRRNAQEIDINRDAIRLQTPEGRALKALRDKVDPVLGFNLHNQNWSTSVGRPPKPASISLLAVSHDEARSDNPRRILAKKVSAVIRDAIEPLLPGQIGRYDDEFEVRAFGDNVAKWGTGVVLIETGPAPGAEPDRQLIRANFVALVTALDALASGRVERANPKRYEELPFNESRLLHTLVVNATLISGTGIAPYTADVGIAGSRFVRRGPGGERSMGLSARIADIGDLRTSGALETIDATGLTAAPLWDDGLKAGAEVSLPDWSSWKGATLRIGQPPNLVLLAPLSGTVSGAANGREGRYRVERVIRLAEPERK